MNAQLREACKAFAAQARCLVCYAKPCTCQRYPLTTVRPKRRVVIRLTPDSLSPDHPTSWHLCRGPECGVIYQLMGNPAVFRCPQCNFINLRNEK